MTIVGGRNIADEYYQSSETEEFLDEDLLAAGHVVDDVSSSFDKYWNAREASPVRFLRPMLADAEASSLFEDGRRLIGEPRALEYIESLDVRFAERLLGGDVVLEKARAEVIYDLPEKIRSLVRNQAGRTSRHLGQLSIV